MRLNPQVAHFLEVVDGVLRGDSPGPVPAGMIDVALHPAAVVQLEEFRLMAVIAPRLVGLADAAQRVFVARVHTVISQLIWPAHLSAGAERQGDLGAPAAHRAGTDALRSAPVVGILALGSSSERDGPVSDLFMLYQILIRLE